jgi:hypothetical protein
MSRIRTYALLPLAVLVGACAASQPPPKHAGAQSVADAETQKAVVDLIQITLICLKFSQPIQPGEVVLAGVFSSAGSPTQVFDSASTPGNELVISCVGEQADRVRSPRSPPSRFVLYAIPIPVRADKIAIYFPDKDYPGADRWAASCRPPVAWTNRIHRISPVPNRPLPPHLENAKPP